MLLPRHVSLLLDTPLIKPRQQKIQTVDTTKNVASYVGEGAAAAKDATVEGGKGVAGYAGKVAAEAKDQAVATGWGETHHTLGGHQICGRGNI